MIIEPKVRGFICTTAHPVGCAANVQQQINYVLAQKKNLKGAESANSALPKKVLIIGASTGYGLASRIVAAFGNNAATIGVSFEKEASDKRTASAGWYNTAAFETEAGKANLYAKSINGDAFSDAIKQQTIDLIKQDWGLGSIDLVVYSVASPRRQEPQSGVVYNSVLKPVGAKYKDKTVNVMSGEVGMVEIEPATTEEIANTAKVMGGDDWQLWIDALLEAKLLATGALTVAYSYVGPSMTYPIYRNGTIGKAKDHLEQTAHALTATLKAKINGAAYVSVNKGLVTQASSAIPVVPLYISLLYKVMKAHKVHETCIEQMWRLYSDRLYKTTVGGNNSSNSNGNSNIEVDSANRIRIDDWEMRADIQQEVLALWQQVNTENLESIADIAGYREDFYKLFGFHVAGIDYTAELATVDVAIPSIPHKVVV